MEARWGVWLDEMGASWMYEPEGYDLASGWYLPDFLIRHPEPFDNQSFWLEVKGSRPTERELSLAAQLSLATSKNTILVCGDPMELDLFNWHPKNGEAVFSKMEKTDASLIAKLLDLEFCTQLIMDKSRIAEIEQKHGARVENASLNAAFSARAARFEHGEMPRFYP